MYILYIFIYIYVPVNFLNGLGTLKKIFFLQNGAFFGSFLMDFHVYTVYAQYFFDPDTLQIMFYHFFTSNTSLV